MWVQVEVRFRVCAYFDGKIPSPPGSVLFLILLISITGCKDTLPPTGMRSQVPARRCFENNCIRLGIRARNLQSRPVLRSDRAVDENLQESRAFVTTFCTFWGPITRYPLSERRFCSRSFFDDDY